MVVGVLFGILKKTSNNSMRETFITTSFLQLHFVSQLINGSDMLCYVLVPQTILNSPILDINYQSFKFTTLEVMQYLYS